jgi:hypothetical protein
MECGHDAPAPQSNENTASWLSRCAETAGSSTANEDLWEDAPDDLQDEGDEEIARLAIEWRRDDAAELDNNHSWQASVKVDRRAGDRWNVWHHDGPHTVQSDTTRCGDSRVGHAAKRPVLQPIDFTSQ